MNQLLARFERTLSASDSKHNLPFQVQVPAGTTRLDIRLTFSPWIVDDIKNLITLTVFDPSGFRGAGHRHGDDHRVTLNAQYATPGYGAGPIQAGEWTVVVDTHMIMPGAPLELRLQVDATDTETPSSVEPAVSLSQGSKSRAPSPRGRGWYRGDLHAHTLHSDAKWDIPDLLAWAREEQLDFMTLSDHNTVSGLAELDAMRDERVLTMGGMELTTFWGHALALGLREWVDWRVREGERTIEQIEEEINRQEETFIIAHPMHVGDPYCTGCQWRYETMMPGAARLVEAWNGRWAGEGGHNERALAAIYHWLNGGHRLALTAGTDNHGREQITPGRYGFNVVLAEELSEQAVLRAVRLGHSYLSSGPSLELNALAGDEQAMMGDVLKVSQDAPVKMTARWDSAPAGAELNLIMNGRVQDRLPVGGEGAKSWQLEAGEAKWGLVTVREPEGTMLALTNPIYLDGRE